MLLSRKQTNYDTAVDTLNQTKQYRTEDYSLLYIIGEFTNVCAIKCCTDQVACVT